MADNRNFAALDWLIHEISETLKEARQALESYVENPKDAARIRFCLTHIHQVHGSLQMVEFYGAAMLASEMEQLTQAMISERVANSSEAQEVLMRAILQFPLYLDQVKATRKDNPLVVLPLLNDLRAVRGESLLTDTKLFVPNLTPAKKVSGARLPVTNDNVQFQAMVLKLRQMYQYAASGFIRGVNPDENLAYLQKAFSRLQKLTHGTARFALWDICLALVEAIEIDAIEISVAVKNLLRQLDKEIKVLAVHGNKALNSFTNDELIKNLLYYVARAGKHAPGFPPNSQLQRVYETYHLEEALLEGKEGGEETQNMLSVPDAEAMRSVVGALKEELNLIKDSLDICLAGGDTHAALSDALPIVKRVADTMAVLGLGDLRKRVLEQGAALDLVVESSSELTDEQLLAVASQLISVENALDALIESGGQDTSNGDDSDITLTRAKESVLRESRNGLEHAKDAIIEYIASQWNRQHLQTVPTTLREIRGGLEIMPLPRPARILGACARFIEEQLLEQDSTPQWSTLDTLADAITSVEYYLERLSSGGRKEENDLLLSVAEESVASLGYAVAKTSKNIADNTIADANLETLHSEDEHETSAEVAAEEQLTAAYQGAIGEGESAADESVQLSALYAEVQAPADDVAQELASAYSQAFAEPTAIAPLDAVEEITVEDVITELDGQETDDAIEPEQPEQTLVATSNAPVIQRDDDDIDDEIIGIFIEEATEVTETIGQYFPRWAHNFDDNNALTEFRRAFHTLKGSGRMVGANEIGELAWSIENMLNRVIDRTIVAGAMHVHIIEKVRQLLPDMIAAFRDNQPNPHAGQAETYRQQAHDLSQGETPEALLEELGHSTIPAPANAVETNDADEAELVEPQPGEDEFTHEAELELELETEVETELELEPVALETEVVEEESALPELKLEYDAQLPEETEALASDEELVLDITDLPVVEVDEDEILDLDMLGDEEQNPPLMSLDDQVELIDEDEVTQLAQLYSEHQATGFNYSEATNDDIDIDDPDAQLWDIFGAEALTHLQVVQDYIARMEAEAPIYEPPSEGMQRALHTLKGSAHMAEVSQVAELATPLERFAKELRSYHVNINDDILQLLRDAVVYTQIALHQIATGETIEIPRLQQFIARVNELREIHVAPLVSLQELDESGKRPVDPELLAIFMAEEMNLLLDADKIIAQWQADPADAAQLIPVMDELGKLTKAAAHAYLPAMAELSEKIYSVYETVIADQLKCSPSVCATLNTAHIALLDMVDAIAAGQNLNGIPEAVNDALDDLLSTEAVTISTLINDEIPALTDEIPLAELDEVIELDDVVSYTAPVEADDDVIELIDEEDYSYSSGHTELPEFTATDVEAEAEQDDYLAAVDEPVEDEDYDPEIVEIFIEEAGELLEDIDRSLNEWQDDWNNTENVEELKRSLHTFKGGARLAGLSDLGDLSHDFETILIEMPRDAELDQSFFNRLHDFQDRMHSGVERAQARMSAAPVAAISEPSASFEPEPPLLENYVDDEPEFVSVDEVVAEIGFTEVEEPNAEDDAPAFNKPTIVVDNTRNTGLVPFDHDGGSSQKPNVLTFAPKAKPAAAVTGVIPGTEYGGGLRSGNTGPAQVQHLAARRTGPQEVVKVSAELLEELVNLAGETSISRSRMEQQVSDLGGSIEEMDSTIQRLQEQLRRLDIETEAQVLFRQEQMAQHEEFDPLEMDRYSQLQQLSRSLIESASDLMDLKYTLADKTRDTETLLLQQSRINTDLQEGLMRSRMVPFSRLVPRLRRIVRQAATELGKEVDFELDNVEGELDRTVLERMVAPLEHMLRNAVDHGIEMPDERIAAGKNPNGRILLTLGREGGDVILRLIDDGRGINLKRVREKAVERGLMAADAQLADQDVIQFILHAGFSTAEKVTQISGRGVGMDVVHSEIKQLGGAMFIDSNWGNGTEFTIRLPFTVSVNRALMVQIGDDLYAIPLNSIEGIVRVSPFELEHYYQDDSARFDYAGENYLVRYLGSLLDSSAQPKLDGQTLPLPVVLVRSTEHTVALQVDRLLGSREIVVKTLGAQFSAVRGVSGATVMGDGSVVVILDLHAMIREQLALGLQNAILLEPLQGGLIEEDQSEKTIMVVDDSVTVRKVTGRFLEREGFRVIAAKDGVEALQLLQDHVPDVMLLDIEMPRMDGFEVAKNIRTSSRLKHLPIIMITSRTGEKHRERAFSLGVNKYMGKPYQEDLLLTNINELLGKTVK